jgi:cytochrome c553
VSNGHGRQPMKEARVLMGRGLRAAGFAACVSVAAICVWSNGAASAPAAALATPPATPPPGLSGKMPADFPQWAFPGSQSFSIPASTRQFATVTMFDRTRAVDWFPEGHGPMPDIVKGRLPVFACGFCHLPEGAGRPENAALAGLKEDYFLRQVKDFKAGTRRSPDPKFNPTANMIGSLHQIDDGQFASAAKYYSGLTYRKHVKLIESASAPVTSMNGFVYVFDQKGTERLGDRIIEGPEDFERFERRDPNLTLLAYVPVGSIARGAVLARGAGARPDCSVCHGPGLKGTDIAPPLAGRPPTGIFRQLYAFKSGDRDGEQAALMKPVVGGLSQKQMIDLAAYAASLEP